MSRQTLLIAILLFSCGGAFCADKNAPPKPFQEAAIGTLAGLVDAQWTERLQDGDHLFRAVKAGGTAVISVPVWWGEGLRPREGTSYLIQIVFKDTAKSPIRIEAFAALPGRYQLHEIGGLNDGEWKTAFVPLPWDMIARLPDTKNTEIAIAAPSGADVPIEKVSLSEGNPAVDEPRWENETRDWIGRVQSSIKNPKLPPAQTAAIPEGKKDSKLIPFVRSYAQLIYPTSTPQEGESDATLKLKLARNEIVCAQFGVFANGEDLHGVRVSASKDDFKDADGHKLKADINLFAAEYAVTSQGIFPQRLWPAYPVEIAQGKSHLFWVQVSGDRSKPKAGNYTGKIVIATESQTAELPVSIEISPIDLLSMKECDLHIGSCVAGLLPAHELDNLPRHNQNSINLWFSSFAPKIVKKSASEFDLDFTIPDDCMRHLKKAGIENFVYFLGGNPYGFPDTMQLERELYRQVYYEGTNQMEGRKEFLRKVTASPDVLLPEIRPLYKQWVSKFMAHAKKEGWPEPILTPFDEPAKWSQGPARRAKMIYYVNQKTKSEVIAHPFLNEVDALTKKETDAGNTLEDLGTGGADTWIKSHFKDSCAAIHEAAPGTRIYGSIHHAGPGLPFLDDIEVFCTNAIHEDAKLGDKVRAGGATKTFWQYSGSNDASDPSTGRYSFGFFFAAFNSRGSLCWAYNFGKLYDTSSGENWIIAFTTPYSVVHSPFFEGLREAWNDRRYIETLKVAAKKKGKEQEANDLLEEIFNTAAKSRTEGGRDTVNDFWARSKDPDALDTMRDKIRTMLVELEK